MFSLKRILLISMVSITLSAFADDTVPVQVYREAIDPNAPAAPVAVPASPAAPATPKATSAPTPVTGTVETKPSSVTPSPVPAASTTVPSMPSAPAIMPSNGKSIPSAASTDSNIQQQIDLINQNNLIFAQSVNSKIDALNSQVADLQTRLQQLSQAMMLLNQELRQKTMNTMVSRSPGTVFARYTWFDYVFWFAAVVLLMIILSFFRRGSRASAAPVKQAPAVKTAPVVKPANKPAAATATAPTAEKKQPAEDLEGDYDYLGSSESIPAKLNLARAYIAMGNHVEAQQVLKEVLETGDNKQCMEAEALLKKIPPA